MDDAFFRLDGPGTTQVWYSRARAVPRLVYWSAPLPADEDLGALAAATEQPLPHGALDVEEVASWLPEPGRGFTDHPGLLLRCGERLLYTQFTLDRGSRDGECGWRFELTDAANQLALELTLQLDAASGVFSASTTLFNLGDETLAIDALATIALPVSSSLDERIAFGGQWAREFQAAREPIGSAGWLQESRTGRTSHHAWPGVILAARGTNWARGEAMAAQIAWSGNHRLLLQRCRLGGTQLQLGELLLPGEVALAPGGRHVAPAAHFVRTEQGLRDLALRWHRFVRTKVLLPQARERARRVQFSSWEATYFEHDRERLFALAERAAAVGVERFVLDDGWFAGRRHDRAGLGDWFACPERYPQGLDPLAQHCRSLGMQFGLWVEPEGINADSDLYRAHPEWVLGVPGREQPLGRQQYVLDLGRNEVCEHLFERLSAVLRSAPIDYLKWDMNRDMTHPAGADGRAGARAHVLGVYALMDRLRAAFPALEIETCASGGARADLGILARTCRVWASDCNDPLERQRVHAGFLAWLPPELMGAHVGDARSHTTGRPASIAMRTLTALFGHFGIEADLLKMANEERETLARAVAEYKVQREWFYDAHITPIDPPHESLAVVLVTAADGHRGWLSVVALDRLPTPLLPPLKIPMPDLSARYQLSFHSLWPPEQMVGAKQASTWVSTGTLALSGQVLARLGLALPVPLPGCGYVITFREILRCEPADVAALPIAPSAPI
jgi:alpha-galactosidase